MKRRFIFVILGLLMCSSLLAKDFMYSNYMLNRTRHDISQLETCQVEEKNQLCQSITFEFIYKNLMKVKLKIVNKMKEEQSLNSSTIIIAQRYQNQVIKLMANKQIISPKNFILSKLLILNGFLDEQGLISLSQAILKIGYIEDLTKSLTQFEDPLDQNNYLLNKPRPIYNALLDSKHFIRQLEAQTLLYSTLVQMYNRVFKMASKDKKIKDEVITQHLLYPMKIK